MFTVIVRLVIGAQQRLLVDLLERIAIDLRGCGAPGEHDDGRERELRLGDTGDEFVAPGPGCPASTTPAARSPAR